MPREARLLHLQLGIGRALLAEVALSERERIVDYVSENRVLLVLGNGCVRRIQLLLIVYLKQVMYVRQRMGLSISISSMQNEQGLK